MANFWSKKTNSPTPPENPVVRADGEPEPVASELEKMALDNLGAVLRVWGKYAFDLDGLNAKSIRQQCEQWARHVLVVAPPPDSMEPVADAGVVPADPQLRDWHGLRQFAADLRRKESAYVTHQFKDTRQVIGDFVQTLGAVLAEDQEEQSRIAVVINQLRTTIETNAPLDILSREAMRAVNLISRIAEERNQRHQQAFQEMTTRLQTLRGELDAARHEMELDPLTRLYNRKAFDEQLARVCELHRLSGQPACLLMLDVDHFKAVNDSFGHPVGDLVLKQLSGCCLYTFPRKSDFVARYGGEEFAIILQETPLKTALALGERLLKAIRSLRITHDQTILSITASIGLAEFDPRTSTSQWLREADDALYRAKRSGRDRLECQPVAFPLAQE
ncbi:MAG: diguanylate cyclase [Candidatus Competibacteraceae bacterium]|nr:diguanylate cyclase [Candidatus Competibacteraceae bacterium]